MTRFLSSLRGAVFLLCAGVALNVPAKAAAALKISKSGGSYGLYAESGEEIAPCVYEEIRPGAPGTPYLVRHDGCYGFVGSDGVFVTDLDFTAAEPFALSPEKNPCAAVRKNGAWNFIDENGVPVFVRWRETREMLAGETALADFYLTFRRKHADAAVSPKDSRKRFVTRFVNRQLKQFTLKGRYESAADYGMRVNEGTLREKTEELTRRANDLYFASHTPEIIPVSEFRLAGYDPDNAVMRLTHPVWGEFLLPVPGGDKAADFESAWARGGVKVSAPSYALSGDGIAVVGLSFSVPATGASYAIDSSATFRQSRIDIDIGGYVETAGKIAGTQTAGGKIVVREKERVADVDRDIPENPVSRERPRFALVIANESYSEAPDVPFALKDGRYFDEYCRKTLGIDAKNVSFVVNATGGSFSRALREFCKRAKSNPGAELIFYYAGHGVPADGGRASYLLPTDVDGAYAKDDGISLEEIYDRLSETEAAQVVVLLDSCFSGTLGKEGARGVRIRSEKAEPRGNMIVLSAASGTQESQPYREGSHGLFTYFLLKKLKESGGAVSVGDLFEYLRREVPRAAGEAGLNEQTPELQISSDFADGLNARLR